VAANPAYLVGYRKRPDSLSADPIVAHRARLAAVDAALEGRAASLALRRWIRADSLLATAAILVQSGQLASGVRFLVAASVGDPRHAAADLGQRLANRAAGASGARSSAAGQLFLETPATGSARPPSVLLAARLRALADLDRADLDRADLDRAGPERAGPSATRPIARR
jgi:hypothetical protein